MTGEEFMQLYLGDRELRQYIVDLVKAYTSDVGRRAHLLYTAWIDISNAQYGMVDEYYHRRAYCALRREWEVKYLEKCRFPSDSPAIQRVNRKIKAYVME